jgi:type IV pilus assembly protein PilY1
MKTRTYAAALAVALTGLIPYAAWAQVTVVDNFTQGSAAVAWVPFNGACLTAGDGTGTIPACVGLPYYTEPLVGGATGLQWVRARCVSPTDFRAATTKMAPLF